jgi:hypothetical protein
MVNAVCDSPQGTDELNAILMDMGQLTKLASRCARQPSSRALTKEDPMNIVLSPVGIAMVAGFVATAGSVALAQQPPGGETI